MLGTILPRVVKPPGCAQPHQHPACVTQHTIYEVVLRLRHVRDEVAEQWACEAVARGTRAAVDTVAERVEVNRDRLLLALHAVYEDSERSVGGDSRW